MPTHKGIKLSVVSQWELKIHPEFPHPDSSQFTFRSPNLKKYGYTMDYAHPSASFDSKADRLLGRQSSVSVYIPSLSGSRFWIRYCIMEEPAAAWCYFKLFMNGRHITSWGINARKSPSGNVMRALFDPSERWNYKDNGTVYKNNGTEARPFFFNREVDGCSAASDGGLIEVLVFRATGRRRRLASLEEFKNQEQYGILMPSGGLLDRPEDAKYYDWHLKDPKDNPFATFRFHYRSWDHLVSLQLIPADHPRTLLPATRSLLSLNGEPRTVPLHMEAANHPDTKVEIEETDSGGEPRDSLSSDNSTTPWMTTVFDDSPVRENTEERCASTVPREGSLLYPDQCIIGAPLSKFSDAALNVPTCMQPGFWAHTKDRPLPEIPTGNKLANHSRNSSTFSHAPSIAASLLPYLERESNTSPEPVIGVAAIVPIVRAGFCDNCPEEEQSFDLSSGLCGGGVVPVNIPVPWTAASKRQGMASPPLGGIFNLPNISIRNNLRPSDKSEARPEDEDFTARTDDGHDDHENTAAISLTESEWMCRTPSPMKAEPDRFSVENLSSTGFESNRPPEERSSLRKKAMDWYDEIRGHEVPDQTPTHSRFRHGLRIRAGNWI